MRRPDRWDVAEVLGAGLLGGGIWAQWGAPWACMLWGLLLLAGVIVRSVLQMPRREG